MNMQRGDGGGGAGVEGATTTFHFYLLAPESDHRDRQHHQTTTTNGVEGVVEARTPVEMDFQNTRVIYGAFSKTISCRSADHKL